MNQLPTPYTDAPRLGRPTSFVVVSKLQGVGLLSPYEVVVEPITDSGNGFGATLPVGSKEAFEALELGATYHIYFEKVSA